MITATETPTLPGRLRANPARAAMMLGHGAPDPFAPSRAAMIDSQLRTSDVTDPAVITAIGTAPREAFVPPARAALAYADRTVPLDAGDPPRSLNAPLATGRLLVAAAIRPGERVLVLGAATGYAALLAARLGAEVVAHDDDDALAAMMADTLSTLAPGVRVARGPLTAMLADPALAGLFDVVLIDGAVERLPDGLERVMTPDGRLVTGLVEGAVTRLARAFRAGDAALAPVAFADTGCVLLPAHRRPPAFRF